MRRVRDEEWPDWNWGPPRVEGAFWRGFAAGLMISWPIWLGLYLFWRWLT